MDPFTCLSVATSIIQIADFGARIFATGQQIYRDGSITMHAEIVAAAEDLKQLNQRLRSVLSSPSDGRSALAEDEEVRPTLKHHTPASVD
jgi:hypothetical protein